MTEQFVFVEEYRKELAETEYPFIDTGPVETDTGFVVSTMGLKPSPSGETFRFYDLWYT